MSHEDKWTADDMPGQKGKVAIVTGANSGIGLAAARILALKGAKVILAVRSSGKGNVALKKIKGAAEVMSLDLAELASVKEFSKNFRKRYAKLHLLITTQASWRRRIPGQMTVLSSSSGQTT